MEVAYENRTEDQKHANVYFTAMKTRLIRWGSLDRD